jgi:hypothetical protein
MRTFQTSWRARERIRTDAQRGDVVPPIVWKILISLGTGGSVYLLSILAHQSQEWNLLLSVFVGGVILVVQFLIDFERSLEGTQKSMDHIVEEGFEKTAIATKAYSNIINSPVRVHVENLVENLTGLTDQLPGVAVRLARSEIDNVAQFLKGLTERRAVYDGEDQDWLLELTQEAKETIDATSTTDVDGGSKDFADSFWTSSLGQRYLRAQRDAAFRQVVVRRLFILNPSETSKPSFQKICKEQVEAGIDVRILDPEDIPSGHDYFIDFIIFDRAVCYEAIPARRREEARIVSTQLNVREKDVNDKCKLFEELWKSGHRPTRATHAEPLEA